MLYSYEHVYHVMYLFSCQEFLLTKTCYAQTMCKDAKHSLQKGTINEIEADLSLLRVCKLLNVSNLHVNQPTRLARLLLQ